jgi:probable F420-dependent oxidoreductase
VRPIQLSIGLPSYAPPGLGDWTHLLEAARAADRVGVDRVVVSDHVAFGERLEEYAKPELGGQAGGKQSAGSDGDWLEPVTTLSVLAGITTRVRLGTNILLAALRRPIVLSKTLATLDVLSGGRLDIGVGVGWQREEYEAAGLSFEGRGRLLDHTLEVCEVLWRERRARYDSPELHFDAIHQMPKPAQAGGVPIWVSGTINPRTVNRLARFGAGWIPWGPDASNVASIARMRRALEMRGRDPETLQIVWNLPSVWRPEDRADLDTVMRDCPGLAERGVTDFRMLMPATFRAIDIEAELAAVVDTFRSEVGPS